MIFPYPEQSAAIRQKLEQGQPLAACLCTNRCHKCDDWWGDLRQLSENFGEVCFVWLDVDENPDMVADIPGIDAFPFMVLRADAQHVAYTVPASMEDCAASLRALLHAAGQGQELAPQKGEELAASPDPALHAYLLE